MLNDDFMSQKRATRSSYRTDIDTCRHRLGSYCEGWLFPANVAVAPNATGDVHNCPIGFNLLLEEKCNLVAGRIGVSRKRPSLRRSRLDGADAERVTRAAGEVVEAVVGNMRQCAHPPPRSKVRFFEFSDSGLRRNAPLAAQRRI